MYNHTGLQGRLTADPELRYTQQGTAITSFTLASDTGRKTKDCLLYTSPSPRDRG